MADALVEWIRAHGAPAIFLFVALENFGIPWITWPAYVVATDLIRLGRMGYAEAVALVSLGHVIGGSLAYLVMRAGENALAGYFRRRAGLRRAHEWLKRWYDRHGAATIVVARLVGQVRPWASLAAGLAGVGPIVFVLWTLIGSVLYSAALLALTTTGLRVWVDYPHARIAIVVLGFIGFFGITIYLITRHLLRQRRAGSSSPAE